MNKVCFISVYFGKIPAYIKSFVESCSWNPQFDWLLIHNEPLMFECPQNVHEVTMDIESFRKKVIKSTNINIPKFKPYKICDFRPAFGIIFQEYIKDYEFWGTCDTDMVLGNLSKFITDEILNTYDKIFTMGHMSVVRNNDECNWLFIKETVNSRNYQDVFVKEKNFIYDEIDGFTEKFCDCQYKVYKEKKCADVSIVCGRLRVNEKWFIKCIQPRNRYIKYSEDKNFKHQIFWLDNGKVYRTYIDEKGTVNKEEYSYIHKIEYSYKHKLKKEDSFIFTAQGYVSNDKVIDKLRSNSITADDLDRYNKMEYMKEIIYDIYWYLRWKFRYGKAFIKNILIKEQT